jgi:hypothetical protein
MGTLESAMFKTQLVEELGVLEILSSLEIAERQTLGLPIVLIKTMLIDKGLLVVITT